MQSHMLISMVLQGVFTKNKLGELQEKKKFATIL